MNIEQQNEILSQAIETFGINNQLDMVVEECGELIQAINKVKRSRISLEKQVIPSNQNYINDTFTYFNLCSEVADVKIMLMQLELILNKEAIDISVERKIKRLEKRMNQ
jgi:NTP pyrophosphatase (non-canonical NTP hydrolase)